MMALAQKCTSQTQICMNILYTFMYMYMSYIIFEIGVDIEANRSSMISRFGIFGVLVPFSFLLFFFSFFFGKAVPFEFVSNSVIIGREKHENEKRATVYPLDIRRVVRISQRWKATVQSQLHGNHEFQWKRLKLFLSKLKACLRRRFDWRYTSWHERIADRIRWNWKTENDLLGVHDRFLSGCRQYRLTLTAKCTNKPYHSSLWIDDLF